MIHSLNYLFYLHVHVSRKKLVICVGREENQIYSLPL